MCLCIDFDVIVEILFVLVDRDVVLVVEIVFVYVIEFDVPIIECVVCFLCVVEDPLERLVVVSLVVKELVFCLLRFDVAVVVCSSVGWVREIDII